MKPDYLTKIKLATRLPRRHVRLDALIEPMAGYSWGAIFSQAFLHEEGVSEEIKSFSDIGKISEGAGLLYTLSKLRKGGKLTEGRHHLPAYIVTSLRRAGREPVLFREIGDDEVKSISVDDLRRDLYDLAPSAEEIEMWDSSESWYLRSKDDDPLMFLFTNDELVERLEHYLPRNFLALPSDFIYAD